MNYIIITHICIHSILGQPYRPHRPSAPEESHLCHGCDECMVDLVMLPTFRSKYKVSSVLYTVSTS